MALRVRTGDVYWEVSGVKVSRMEKDGFDKEDALGVVEAMSDQGKEHRPGVSFRFGVYCLLVGEDNVIRKDGRIL